MGVIACPAPGLLAGAIAKAIPPGHDPGGCLGTTAIATAGAFPGGRLSAHLLGRPAQQDFFDAATRGPAVAGALALPVTHRPLFGSPRDRRGTSHDRAGPGARPRHPSTFSTVM